MVSLKNKVVVDVSRRIRKLSSIRVGNNALPRKLNMFRSAEKESYFFIVVFPACLALSLHSPCSTIYTLSYVVLCFRIILSDCDKKA